MCAVDISVTTRQLSSLWLLGGNGDVGEIVTSLNDAFVLTMSTLVSCVPRFSNHDLLLVVVFPLCFFMWELADVTRGLIVNGFLLLFYVRVHLLATRNSSFACWCHSTCATLSSQVRLLHLIFAVPQNQEQIVGCLWS